MKKSIVNYLFAMLISVSAFANGTPSKSFYLMESDKLSISTQESDINFFESVRYNTTQENLSFDLNKEVAFLQIFDQDNNLLYQLPVMTNKIILGGSIFQKGHYKLGFMMKESKNLHFAHIEVNQ